MSVLIDANIFVYAPADPDKHEKALRLIEEVTRRGDLSGQRLISTGSPPYTPRIFSTTERSKAYAS